MILSLLLVAACSSATVVARDDRAPVAALDVTPEGASNSADPEANSSANSPESDIADGPEADSEAGFGLGGVEQLASLTDDCVADSDLACDILFQLTALDSEEEAIALSCGGRRQVDVIFCSEGIVPDGQTLAFDITSPALDQLVADCESGDMTTCDFLFYRSPVGSSFEELGFTCGGRVAVATPDCRTTLPE